MYAVHPAVFLLQRRIFYQNGVSETRVSARDWKETPSRRHQQVRLTFPAASDRSERIRRGREYVQNQA
ncbi:unnamed protein product [Pylaiella littoralis]